MICVLAIQAKNINSVMACVIVNLMSDNIIPFKPRKEKESLPDDDQIYIDHDGVTWYHYTCSYKIDDTSFCFSIWALSMDDAERRLQALKNNATVDGQLYSEFDY